MLTKVNTREKFYNILYYIKGKLPAVFLDSIRATVFCLTVHFVFNLICASNGFPHGRITSPYMLPVATVLPALFSRPESGKL